MLENFRANDFKASHVLFVFSVLDWSYLATKANAWSLQNVNDIYLFLMICPCVRLDCKLVPFQYWENENGLRPFGYFYYCLVAFSVVTCPSLSSPPGSVQYGCAGNSSEYPHDTVCRFSCFDGYRAIGSNVRRCQQNGLWSGGEFYCQRKYKGRWNNFILLTDVYPKFSLCETQCKEERASGLLLIENKD